MAEQAEIYEVDIDKAQSLIKVVEGYVRYFQKEITSAEGAAKDALMGLVLTGIETGLIENDTPKTTELRNKIFMAFDIGYFAGKMRDIK